VLVWNVHSLNVNGHHDVVRELVTIERPSIVCLQETKRVVFNNLDIIQLLGAGFDYAYLPAIQTRGDPYCMPSGVHKLVLVNLDKDTASR
jgi:exonuclease III